LNSRAFLARAFAEMGEFGRGVALAEASVALSEAADHGFCLGHNLYALGLNYLRQGELARATTLLERALDLARARTVTFFTSIVGAGLTMARALSGRFDEALSPAEQASHDAEATGHTGAGIGAHSALAEVYCLAGRPADSAAAAGRALEAVRRARRRGLEARLMYVLGDIAVAEPAPDLVAARKYYREALERPQACGMRPLIAHCNFGLGKLYQRTGKRELAQEHLTTATTMYREMDMRFWLEKAEAEITRASA